MLFNSYIFIFAFLPVVLVGYAVIRKSPNRVLPIGWVAIASLFYYSWWKPEFLLLLVTSIAVNLAFGKILLSGSLPRRLSQLVLTLGVVFNLGLLCYFKYAGFLVVNANALFSAGLTVPNVLLPIGISFITFQKIAFLVDAHRGLVRNFSVLNYIFFVTFFPQLIAGPIIHHSEVMPQLAEAPRRDFAADLAVGFSLFIVGLFKKVVIADTLAVYADAGYGSIKAGQALDPASAWIAVLCYTFQLYYDFSGYSDMAIGLGRMFGIRLPVNFYSPYKSSSIIEFWRRWHITLSRFLRDYLYIPLGGNRNGPVRRYFNLFLVMLLGGLWHGANWTFAVWGMAHGLMLALNHAWHALPLSRHRFATSRPAGIIAVLITFLAVTLAWVPFRAESFVDARAMLSFLFPSSLRALTGSFQTFWHAQFAGKAAWTLDQWFKARELWPPTLPADYLATKALPVGPLLLGVLAATWMMPNTYQLFGRFDPALGLKAWQDERFGLLRRLDTWLAIVLAGMFVLSVLRLSRVSPFLYFQF